MSVETKTTKPYVGTYRQYIERIVITIMQQSFIARDEQLRKKRPVNGFVTNKEWNRLKKYGTDQFVKAAKVRP